MKKFLAFFLALTLVLGLCACGGGEGAGGNGDDLTADGKVKLSIGIGTNALVLDHNNNALTKWVEETCGVELEFVEFSGGTDIATQISTKIGARQELPDILFGMSLNEDTLSRYGQDGYFVDLTPYYEDRDGASKIFWDRMENELTEDQQEYVLRKTMDPTTEAFYGVPIVETSLIDKMHFVPWINTQWLDTLGLEMPTDIDSFYKVLKAFKDGDPNGNGQADEIPLFGSESAGLCAYVVDYLINMHTYFNPTRPYTVDDNGKICLTYTTDAYREGLKFVNKLYNEGLLTSLAWSASSNEMKQITTPSSGTALCGIFLGHLTVHATMDNEVMYQYAPMPMWHSVIRDDISAKNNTFITENCEESKRDKAFEVLMTLWSWDGSMRERYGEYGVNWTDPSEGGKSDLGLDATYRLISDPLKMQSTAKWAVIASTLNVYAEGETAEIAEEMTEWMKAKSKMHAEAYNLFEEAESKYNPDNIPPVMVASEEEKQAVEAERTNIGERWQRAQTEFCTGTMDPNDDAQWQAYLDELDGYGMDKYLEYLQTLYDRS